MPARFLPMPNLGLTGGGLLPYQFIASEHGDGAIPYPLIGSTWAVSGGVAINTPTEGANVFSAGDMESGDPPTGWSAQNSATLSANADAHGGSQSLSVLGGASYSHGLATPTVLDDTWYRFRAWIKTLSGLGRIRVAVVQSSTVYDKLDINAAAYAEYTGGVLASSTAMYQYAYSKAATDQNLFDDWTLHPLTLAELPLIMQTGVSDVICRASWDIAYGNPSGVIVNVDSLSSPLNYVIAQHNGRNGIGLIKCVNGVYTEVVTATVNHVSDALVEVRKSGTTYQLFYNNVQQGADQTISDPEIINNTIHGAFSVGGGSQMKSFFVGKN